jgi:hypothetical protein
MIGICALVLTRKLWNGCGINHGTPALVHPQSGTAFGFGVGSLTCALRLPPILTSAALAAGAKTRWDFPAYPELGIPAASLDLAGTGAEWVFGGWLPAEVEWCHAAYSYAAPNT